MAEINSIFESDDLKKSFGEANSEEKNSVSHRFRALQALREKEQALGLDKETKTKDLDPVQAEIKELKQQLKDHPDNSIAMMISSTSYLSTLFIISSLPPTIGTPSMYLFFLFLLSSIAHTISEPVPAVLSSLIRIVAADPAPITMILFVTLALR